MLIAEWVTEEGEWRTLIPVLRSVVEHSCFDTIGQEIRNLEVRLRKRNPHHKVEQTSLELPPGWSTHRGPDSVFAKKEKRKAHNDEEQQAQLGLDLV